MHDKLSSTLKLGFFIFFSKTKNTGLKNCLKGIQGNIRFIKLFISFKEVI